MFQRKPANDVKRIVWRITDAKPLGEFVSPGQVPTQGSTKVPTPAPVPPDNHDRWFRVSSQELAKGSEVTETDVSQLPEDLANAFTKNR